MPNTGQNVRTRDTRCSDASNIVPALTAFNMYIAAMKAQVVTGQVEQHHVFRPILGSFSSLRAISAFFHSPLAFEGPAIGNNSACPFFTVICAWAKIQRLKRHIKIKKIKARVDDRNDGKH